MKRLVLIFGAFAIASACGSDSPSAPSQPAVAQVGGVWRGNFTTVSVTGGECFAGVLQSTIGGADAATASLTQTGSSVNATVTVTSTGSNYTYSGAVGQSALTLNGSNCSACNVIGATCPNGIARRDLKIQTLAITGTVIGNTITGTESETYNVFVGGTTSTVGSVVIANSFTLTRQ